VFKGCIPIFQYSLSYDKLDFSHDIQFLDNRAFIFHKLITSENLFSQYIIFFGGAWQ
jgi:hypothetical protein